MSLGSDSEMIWGVYGFALFWPYEYCMLDFSLVATERGHGEPTCSRLISNRMENQQDVLVKMTNIYYTCFC